MVDFGVSAPELPSARRALLWLLLVGALGTLADLVLAKHWKEITQWPPLVLLGLVAGATAWALRSDSGAAWRAVLVVSWLSLPATAAGLFFHVRANIEWARDDQPTLSGWPLVTDTLFGSLPTLAPGAMLYLGLIGLLAGWRRQAPPDSSSTS